MSAPRTPAEMADWLKREMWHVTATDEQDEILEQIIAFLRAVPTDAQKIEALEFAGEAGFIVGISVPTPEAAKLLAIEDAGHCARAARS